MRRGWFFVGSVAWIAGCASAPPPAPASALSAAEASVRAAREAGASNGTDASTYLAAAEQELSEARWRLRHGDRRAAYGLSLRARADAEVAATIAHMIAARAAARRTADEAELLIQELEKPLPLPDPSTGIRRRDSADPQRPAAGGAEERKVER